MWIWGDTARLTVMLAPAVIAISLRGIREIGIRHLGPVYAFASTSISVGFEHLAAGLAMPLGFYIALLSFATFLKEAAEKNFLVCHVALIWEIGPVKWIRRDRSGFQRRLVQVSCFGYAIRILEHEFGQAFISVYGQQPRGYLQYWQVLVGVFGIGCFYLLMSQIRPTQRTEFMQLRASAD